MSQKVLIGCLGWATDPNTIASAASGALRIARNAMIRIRNVIERRPAFAQDDDYTAGPGATIRWLYEWNDGGTNQYLVAYRNSYTSYTMTYNDGTSLTGLGAGYTSPQEEAYSYYTAFTYRGNLYINGTDRSGPAKLDTGTSTAFIYTPTEPVLSPGEDGLSFTTASATLGVLAVGYSCAWRVVIRREDNNGVITRSAPSNFLRRYNDSADPEYLSTAVKISTTCREGDVIEIYRSKQVSGDIDVADELFLAGEYSITSTDVSPGVYYANIKESTPDIQLGAALYTNASQQGILKANYTPPAAMASAVWSSCAWYGNAWTRPTRLYNLIRTDGTFDDGVPYWGVHETVTASGIVVGSTTVTIAANKQTDIYVGQLISDGTSWPTGSFMTAFQANTRVTDYNATTGVVTFSPAAKAIYALGNAIQFCDVLRITDADNEYVAWEDSVERCVNTVALTPTAQESPEALVVREICNLNVLNNFYGGDADHVIYPVSSESDNGAAFVVRSNESISNFTAAFTVPTDYSQATIKNPPVTPSVSWNNGSGTYPDTSFFYHRVYYSKPDEVEAVPEVNYINIGSAGQRILRMIPLRDSLVVFKQDGIWRISGSAPDQWRVDLVSEDYRLVHSRAVTQYGDLAYAWTNKGIISVSAYGDIQRIDEPIHDQIEAAYLNSYDDILVPSDDFAKQVHAVTHERLGIVIFHMPEIASDLADEAGGGFGASTNPYNRKRAFCFCPQTSAWFEWEITPSGTTASMFHRQAGRLYFARNGVDEVRKEVLGSYQGDHFGYSDAAYSITIASASGLTCQISVTGNFTAKPGSYITQSGSVYRIVSISGSTLTLDRTGIANGAASGVEGAVVTLKWQEQSANLPNVGGRWQEVACNFSDIDDGTSVSAYVLHVGASGDESDAEAYSSCAFPTSFLDKPVVRAWLPRDIARSTRISPFVALFSQGTYWKLNGLSLVYQPTSEKTRRNPNE